MLTKPKSILITGASGAVGGALAEYYAKPGVELILHGRNESRLTELANKCRIRGAAVRLLVLDLREIELLLTWLNANLLQEPPDLLIVNAGMSINNDRLLGEDWSELEKLLDLNIKSSFALVNNLILPMRKRGSGQIVLISSLAAYFGLAITPGDSASKAAVKAYAEALRCWLAPAGIKVNLVMPGDIKSAMCDATQGPKAFMMSPQSAAAKIARGIERNQARISFPFPLNLGAWLLAVLPASWSQFFLKIFGYGL